MNKEGQRGSWEIDPARCTACGDCTLICPVQALRVEKKIAVMADPKSCCGDSCRICEYHCPKGAIRAY